MITSNEIGSDGGDDELAALFATPQISTDDQGRHADDHGREYVAADVDGELTYRPVDEPLTAAAVPPAGPLADWPDVRSAEAWQMLDAALDGLPRGTVDAAAQLQVVELDAAMVAVVASWLRRSFEAGVAAGRAEIVDEQPAVQALRAQAAALGDALDVAQGDAQRFGHALDEVVASAAEIESRLDAAQVSAQGAFERLLAAVERAVGGAR